MYLSHSVEPTSRIRFGLVGVLILAVVLGTLGNADALGNGAQPLPEEGIVYLTRAEEAPNGAIVKLLDPQLGLFQTVVTGLKRAQDILCGSDGRLYVTEWVDNAPFHGLIERFNADGSGRTLVFERIDLTPTHVVIAPNGDLYFGTYKRSQGVRQGIWRIPGALQAEREFPPASQVIPPIIGSPVDDTNLDISPYAFLTTGPFKGDLLIIEAPDWTGRPGGRVLRALAPNFNVVKEFIAPHKNPDTGEPFLPAGLAIDHEGNIFITDFASDEILRYGSDGTFKAVFAKVMAANKIAVGSEGLIYITNWGSFQRGGLFIFDQKGKLMSRTTIAPARLRGVTVCAPQ